jgi:hypothetical protein
MKNDDESRLLEELANLLERQIELARHGDFAGLKRLAGQCEPLVARITAAGLLENPAYKAERERLAKFYRDIRMAISMQKDVTGEQLKSINKGRKTLAIYRDGFFQCYKG